MSDDRNLFFRVLLAADGRLRACWRILIYLVGFVVIQIGATIVVILPLLVIDRGTFSRRSDASATMVLQAIGLIPLLPALIGFTWLCRRFLDRRSLGSMGLGQSRLSLPVLVPGALAAGAAPITLAAAVVLLTGGYRVTGMAFPWSALYIAPMFFGAAFMEELVFRGYLQTTITDSGWPKLAVVVSSILFGLVHGRNPGVWQSPLSMMNLMAAGVLLAVIYRWSGDLWFPTGAHFAWNACQGLVFSVPVSGMNIHGLLQLEHRRGPADLITGGRFGLEGSAVTLGLQLVMIGMFIWWYRRRRAQESAERLAPPSIPVAENDDFAKPTFGVDTSEPRTPDESGHE